MSRGLGDVYKRQVLEAARRDARATRDALDALAAEKDAWVKNAKKNTLFQNTRTDGFIFRALVVADRARLGIGAQAGGVDADRATQGQRVRPVARLRIRRDRLLEDTLSGFAPLGSNAKGRVAVTFVNAAGQEEAGIDAGGLFKDCLLYTSPSPRDMRRARMPSSA